MSLESGIFFSLQSSSSSLAFISLHSLNLGQMKKRKKNKQKIVFGLRGTVRCKTIDSLSTTHAGRSTVIEEHTKFESSFDEYLKAMESVKVVRERKKTGLNVKKENIKKKLSNNSNDGRYQGEERAVKSEKFQATEFHEGKSSSEGSYGVVGKRGRNGGKFGRQDVVNITLKSQEDLTERRWKSGFNKKVSENVDTITSSKVTGSKSKAVDYLNAGNELENKAIGFKPTTFFNNDLQDHRRVTRMEMEERIQKLAKCLNGADIDMPEWMFSKTMQNARIRLCDHSILRVIQILGKLGNWRRVLQVIDWLQRRERFQSHKLRYIYTAALDVLQKSKRPVEALNVFRAMQEHRTSYPDLVSYHCIAVTLGQAGHMKELFDVIDSMRSMPKKFKIGDLEKWDPRVEPNIVIYNAVLNACVRRKKWEGAFWVLQQLKEAGQTPSSTTYGLVMEVMLACGKYNLVHEFFRKAQKSAIPNALTYRVLVNALWREGKTNDAVAAVQDMERRGIVGSASLYYDLARCLCSVGRCQEALIQVDKLCNVASKPLVVTYTGLIQACVDSGNVKDGVYIFEHMQKYCSPNLVTHNIILKALVEHEMLDKARELFQSIAASGGSKGKLKDENVVSPDVYTYNTMLEACVAFKRWDDFLYAYEQMLQNGYHFNSKRHLWMILQASKAGKIVAVEATWKHLIQTGRTPPPALVKERFFIELEKGNMVSALVNLTSHPSGSSQGQLAFSKEAWLRLLKDNADRFKKGTFQRLIEVVNSMICRSESPNVILLNLVASCREILRSDMVISSGVNQTGALCTNNEYI